MKGIPNGIRCHKVSFGLWSELILKMKKLILHLGQCNRFLLKHDWLCYGIFKAD